MSDEAFARRFYSDRAELTALRRPAAVPATSSRAKSRCTRFAPSTTRTARAGRRRARRAPDRPLLPRGFAYAEPLRLALQNLALGRSASRAGDGNGRARSRQRARLLARACGPPGSSSAISKQRTVRFGYWSPRRARPGERTVNPYALRLDDGNWYVIGHDLERRTERTFRVSRIRGDIRFATRRERDFGSPPTSTSRDTDPAAVADRRNGGDGAYLRLGRHRVVGRADALRCRDRRGRSVRDRVRERRPARRMDPAPERPCRAHRAR